MVNQSWSSISLLSLILVAGVSGQCTLCPGGDAPPFPSRTLSETAQSGLNGLDITTCRELNESTQYAQDLGYECKDYQLFFGVTECSCPSQEGYCSICPIRTDYLTDPTIPLSSPGAEGTTTCGFLQASASITKINVEEDCHLYRQFAEDCKCTPLPANEQCTLCPDGTPLSASYASNQIFNGVPDKIWGNLAETCEEASNLLQYIKSSEGVCQRYQTAAAINCGCSGAGQCSVCPNREPIRADPDTIVYPNDQTTCGILEFQAQFTQTSDCDRYTYGASKCGCTKPSDINACTICSNGSSPPNGNNVIPEDGITCSEANTALSFFDESATFCSMKRITGAYDCGCDFELQQGQCSLCANGELPPNEDVVHSPNVPLNLIGFVENPDGKTCRDLMKDLSLQLAGGAGVAEDSCSINHWAFAEACGCSKLPDNEKCDICPGGGTPRNLDGVLYEGSEGPITCRAAMEGLSYVSNKAAICTSSVRQAVNVCDCPERPGYCHLCPKGDSVPDYTKLTDDTGTTCGTYQYLAMTTEKARQGFDECLPFHIIGGLCGCEPLNLAEPCTLCENGEPPKNLDARYGDKEARICGEMADILPQFIPESLTCDMSRTQALDACGCEGGTGTGGGGCIDNFDETQKCEVDSDCCSNYCSTGRTNPPGYCKPESPKKTRAKRLCRDGRGGQRKKNECGGRRSLRAGAEDE